LLLDEGWELGFFLICNRVKQLEFIFTKKMKRFDPLLPINCLEPVIISSGDFFLFVVQLNQRNRIAPHY